MRNRIDVAAGGMALALFACGGTSAANGADAGADSAGVADATTSDATANDAASDANTPTVDSGADAGLAIPVMAMKHLFAGDTDRNGVASATAWQGFGENIDGKTTTAASNDVCTLAAGAPTSVQVDGTDGIDNAFGAQILPILQVFDAQYGSDVNLFLQASAFNFLPRIDANAAFYVGGAALKPAFDGKDIWPALYESLTQGNIATPKVTYPSAKTAAQVWTSGDPSGQGVLVLPLGTSAFVVNVNKLHVSMTLAADGKSATNGTLSGVIPTTVLVDAITKAAGGFSASFCSPTVLNSILQQVEEASDILQDGTNAPGSPCDGISFGFGFESVAASVRGVTAPQTPPVNVCE